MENEVQIMATTNPAPPSGLIVKSYSESEVKLEWMESQVPPTETLVNYAVEYYRVDHKTKQPISGTTKTVNTRNKFITVGALPSGATYIFRVKVC